MQKPACHRGPRWIAKVGSCTVRPVSGPSFASSPMVSAASSQTAIKSKRLSHPNDLVYKSSGTLYFTDNGDPPAGETAELPTSAYLLKKGQVQLITTGQLEHPNGIAVSPDEKFLYINDSAKRQVWRFDIQPDDSAINGRVWLDMSSDKTPGIPDGMRVDKKGNVYDAGPGGIWIVSPEAKHIGTLLIPA